MMLNFHCQSDVIYNYHRNTPLGMSRKVFSERFNWAAKAHPKYGRHHPDGPGSKSKHKKRKQAGREYSCISAS